MLDLEARKEHDTSSVGRGRVPAPIVNDILEQRGESNYICIRVKKRCEKCLSDVVRNSPLICCAIHQEHMPEEANSDARGVHK